MIIGASSWSGTWPNSRVGRAWVAIREDEDAAELMGVPTFRFKLWAFAIGAAVGGLSGTLFAGQASFVNSQTFYVAELDPGAGGVLLGGAGNIGGAILGGFLVVYIPEWLGRWVTCSACRRRPPSSVRLRREPDVVAYFIFGILLIIVMIFRPQGSGPNRRRAAELQDRQKEVAALSEPTDG